MLLNDSYYCIQHLEELFLRKYLLATRRHIYANQGVYLPLVLLYALVGRLVEDEVLEAGCDAMKFLISLFSLALPLGKGSASSSLWTLLMRCFLCPLCARKRLQTLRLLCS